MDLAEWFAAKRWVALLELIDGLPTACRLNEAVANDPETAAYLAELRRNTPEDEGDSWAPKLSEYDLHATLMREMLHEIKGLRQVSIAAAGGKPGDARPFPGPRTAIDRALADAERRWTEEFVTQFGFAPDDI